MEQHLSLPIHDSHQAINKQDTRRSFYHLTQGFFLTPCHVLYNLIYRVKQLYPPSSRQVHPQSRPVESHKWYTSDSIQLIFPCKLEITSLENFLKINMPTPGVPKTFLQAPSHACHSERRVNHITHACILYLLISSDRVSA